MRFVRQTGSIGAKRNAGFWASRGEVVLHWDDDDLHHPQQVSALACPILANMAELTALTFSHLAKLNRHVATFYRYGTGRGHGPAGAFLGSLAYARSVALDVSNRASGHDLPLSPDRTHYGPFALTSLSEDLYFVETALSLCNRMLPISGVPIVYTRHSSVRNTWRPPNMTARMSLQHATEPPEFVAASLRAAYVRAEEDAARRGGCHTVSRHAPAGLKHPPRYPFMPWKCCHGTHLRHSKEQLKRPCLRSTAGVSTLACTSSSAASGESETFCGSTKGVCTARCTCSGDRLHRGPGTTPCGTMCCRFWNTFWQTHPENCSTTRARPLKSRYCPVRG